MNDSEYASRWRTLAAQLHQLEREAGIGERASRSRDAAPASSSPAEDPDGELPDSGHAAHPDPVPMSAAQRRELRAAYFAVPHPSLRRRLIAKQRELELFERTGLRTRLEDARRQVEALRRRPSEGWWIAAIVGATLVIVGYALFAVLGAIAAGVAALFVGNGIEQSARRRFDQAVALAEEDVRAALAAQAGAEQSRDLFTERESATGQPYGGGEGAESASLGTH